MLNVSPEEFKKAWVCLKCRSHTPTQKGKLRCLECAKRYCKAYYLKNRAKLIQKAAARVKRVRARARTLKVLKFMAEVKAGTLNFLEVLGRNSHNTNLMVSYYEKLRPLLI
jgi:hypothetical protein